MRRNVGQKADEISVVERGLRPLLKLLAYLPVVAAMVTATALDPRVSLGSLCFGFAGGLILWTLLEYLLHRFAHELPLRISGGKRPHLGHHARPLDLSVLVTPLSFSLPMTVILWCGLRGVTGSWGTSAAWMLGVVAGYTAYETIHCAVHLGSGSWARPWREYHFRHHFETPHRCYGVTTPLWDVVFGTAHHGRRHAGAGSGSSRLASGP